MFFFLLLFLFTVDPHREEEKEITKMLLLTLIRPHVQIQGSCEILRTQISLMFFSSRPEKKKKKTHFKQL